MAQKIKTVIVENNPLPEIKKGIDTVANVVKETLGPAGRNILIEMGKGRAPRSTRDGVTVANSVKSLDKRLQDFGAQSIKEAARNTNSEAGDGTTTSTILAQAIFAEGLKYIAAGQNPVTIKRSIDMAVEKVMAKISETSIPVDTEEMLKSVATISANNDDFLGGIIAEAIHKVGENGSILVEESRTGKTHTRYQSGMVIERGWMSKFFVTDPRKMIAEYENPNILIVDDNIHSFEQIQNVIRYVAENKEPLILCVRDIEISVLGFLAKNKIERGLKIAVIQNPGYHDGELIEDFAHRVGTRPFDSSIRSLDIFEPKDFGKAKRIIIGAVDSTVIEGCGDITERLVELDEQIKKEEIQVRKNRLIDRRNRLSNSVATICLSAESEVEMADIKYRVEDAIHATKAAFSEGIVAGGGTSLFNAKLDDDSVGTRIINAALEAPIRTLVSNTGDNPDKILAQIEESGLGYNAATKEMCNLIDLGVIDPTRVPKTALQKAASVAGMLLCSGSCIVEQEDVDA